MKDQNEIVRQGSARILKDYENFSKPLLNVESAERLIADFPKKEIKNHLKHLLDKMLESDREKALNFFDVSHFNFLTCVYDNSKIKIKIKIKIKK